MVDHAVAPEPQWRRAPHPRVKRRRQSVQGLRLRIAGGAGRRQLVDDEHDHCVVQLGFECGHGVGEEPAFVDELDLGVLDLVVGLNMGLDLGDSLLWGVGMEVGLQRRSGGLESDDRSFLHC